jgi:hypothetical protein
MFVPVFVYFTVFNVSNIDTVANSFPSLSTASPTSSGLAIVSVDVDASYVDVTRDAYEYGTVTANASTAPSSALTIRNLA